MISNQILQLKQKNRNDEQSYRVYSNTTKCTLHTITITYEPLHAVQDSNHLEISWTLNRSLLHVYATLYNISGIWLLRCNQHWLCMRRESLSSLQIFRCSWQARTIEEHAASIVGTSEEPTTNFSTHFSPQDRASKRLLFNSWSLKGWKRTLGIQSPKSELYLSLFLSLSLSPSLSL